MWHLKNIDISEFTVDGEKICNKQDNSLKPEKLTYGAGQLKVNNCASAVVGAGAMGPLAGVLNVISAVAGSVEGIIASCNTVRVEKERTKQRSL